MESELENKEPPNIDGMKTEAETIDNNLKELREKNIEIEKMLDKTQNMLKELRRASADFEKAEKRCVAVKQLSDTANGKRDFETYAQIAYFERVIRAANIRLKLMSHNRYDLRRKTESDDNRKRTGLEIEVFDNWTGKARSAIGLSGGESFMASLSLALGLSDIVGQSMGGIQLDAMFIDEGFGSLDANTLELAIRTLSEMAGADRIIGIISHVTELSERVEKQVKITKTSSGSKISLAL